MTTIVFTEDGIYADTQYTLGASKYTSSKIFEIGDHIYVGSGNMTLLQEVFGKEDDMEVFTSCCPGANAVHYAVINKDREVRIITRELKKSTGNVYIKINDSVQNKKTPLTLGSGSDYYDGAFAAGGCVKTSFEIAAKFDPYTNNHIEFLCYETLEVLTPFAEV